MSSVVWLLIGVVVGFGIAWLLGKVLASREFDMLLAQEERKHQELINQFEEILDKRDEEIERLKGES